jgi:hypothetical protein
MSVLRPKPNTDTKICDAVELEHDPEKWKPVFRKDHAQNNNLESCDEPPPDFIRGHEILAIDYNFCETPK